MKASELIERYKAGERDFRDVNLQGANLYDANLQGANLYDANLRGANLRGVNLQDAYLQGANLYDANLQGANLRDANLQGANLRWANLEGANLRGANLPSPTMVMLAYWGHVSDELCSALMRYDASAHHDPGAFTKWAEGGPCPYNGVKYQRACNFREKKELWLSGGTPNIFSLMIRLIKEKCEDSDWHV